MQRYSFKMFLNPGCEAEYSTRHDAIWPELERLLREAGVSNYSIHWDAETSLLFAYLERATTIGWTPWRAIPSCAVGGII